MSYELLRSPFALRQLRRLHRTHPQVTSLILAAITALANDPRPRGATRLVGRPEWRIRVGNHRILYHVDDGTRTVTITSVADRRDVYK